MKNPSSSAWDRKEQPGLPATSVKPDHEGREAQEQGLVVVTGVESSSAARTVGLLHDLAGNQMVGAALGGEGFDGFGSAVAEQMTGAVGGLDGAGAMGSNQAMARLLRKATEAVESDAAWRDIATSSGRALPGEHRERLEIAFDRDFAHVRVHADGAAGRAAEALDAHAFALGSDIFFGVNEFRPGTTYGDRLLAHELTHVVQYDQGRLGSGTGVSSPSDPHEREAYANESRILRRLDAIDAEGPSEVVPDAIAQRVSVALGVAADAAGGSERLFSEGLHIGRGDDSPEVAEHDAAEEALLRLAGLDENGAAVVPFGPDAGRTGRVYDADDARRAVTVSLLDRIAPRLGLNPATLEIRVDEQATARLGAVGAPGVAVGQTVYIDPGAFDPATRAGQHVLAHELAHVAQATLPADDLATGAHAEADANLFAQAVVSGRATEGAVVPMPEGHVAAYTAPNGAALGATVEQYKGLAQQREEASKMAADAAGQDAPKGDVTRPDEKERDELEDFEDGLDASIDELEDTYTFEDMVDAIDDGGSPNTYLGRFRGNDHYENVVEMYKGALKHETKSSQMKSLWVEEWDRDWLTQDSASRVAYAKLKAQAESDAKARLAAEKALADLEEARRQEEAAKKQVKDEGGPDPGEGANNGAGANGGPKASDATITPVTPMPPNAPSFERAETRMPAWGAAQKEYAHHNAYNTQMAAGKDRGWSRTGQVFGQFGMGFLSGFGGGLVNGLKDKFLTDVVGGGLDKVMQGGLDKVAGGKFGGAMKGVPFASNMIKAAQSGLLTDLVSGNIFTGEGKVWDGWREKGAKAGEAMDGMGSVIDAWGNYSGWDRVGLVVKFAADLFQFLAEIVGLIADVLSTIETICWVLGGLFIILGICFSWCGLGFLVGLGLNVVRVARALKKINDILSPIVDALSAMAAVLRVISALMVPAEFYGAELAATGDAGEFFGDKAGGQVADTVADDAKKWAQADKPAADGGKKDPIAEGDAQGTKEGTDDAALMGGLGEENANTLKDLEQEATEEGKQQQQTLDDQEQNKKKEEEAKKTEGAEGEKTPDDATKKPEDSKTKKVLGAFYKYSGFEGIWKMNPVTTFKESRENVIKAYNQVDNLINNNWDDQSDAAKKKIADQEAVTKKALDEALASDPKALDLANKLSESERKLANMKGGDADPKEIEKVEADIKKLRDDPNLKSVVDTYDKLHKKLALLESRYKDVRDAEREDVQGGILNKMKEQTEEEKLAWQKQKADRDVAKKELEGLDKRPVDEITADAEKKKKDAAQADLDAEKARKEAESYTEKAEQQAEFEKKQADVDRMAQDHEGRKKSAEETAGLKGQVEQVEKLRKDADTKEADAKKADLDAKAQKQQLQQIKDSGATVKVAGNDEPAEIHEVRPEGLVVGPDRKVVPWSDVEGPQNIVETGNDYSKKVAEAETLKKEADDLDTQVREQQMSMAQNGWNGQSSADLDKALVQSNADIAASERKLEESRGTLGEPPDSNSSADLLKKAQELETSAGKLESQADTLEKDSANLEKDLKRRQELERQVNAAIEVGAMVDAHNKETSEKGGPEVKESKRGSGLFKTYLTQMVNGGNSSWLKVVNALYKGGFSELLGIKGEAEKKATDEAAKIKAAEEGLTKKPEEKTAVATGLEVVTDPGGIIKGKITSGFESLGFPRAYKDLLAMPPAPVEPTTLQDQFNAARAEMDENARYHARAYNCYLMEVAAGAKSIEAEALASEVGTMALERAQAQEGPIQEGQSNEAKRQQMLASNDPNTKPADPGISGWMMDLIMMAVSEGGDEVDGAPADAKDADPSKSQDEADATAKETQEGNMTASEEQTAYLEGLASAQKEITSSIDADKQSVEEKAAKDYQTMQEIRGMKEDNIGKATTHYNAGEAKASEFNTSLDGFVVWAADYKAKREKVGMELGQA